MAVYTPITEHDVRDFFSRYALGVCTDKKDILSGVENSNFLITVNTAQKYILTIYEKRVREDELPFYINLMQHLASRGIPCPTALADKDGHVLQRIKNKPAALVSFLNGSMATIITPDHCHQVGMAMAKMHLAVDDFHEQRKNNLSPTDWGALIARCSGEHSGEQSAEHAALLDKINIQNLTAEHDALLAAWPQPQALPRGAVHADLFPDNVFFEHDKLCGVIDFYLACTDFFAYDLAIAINAWCFDDAHVFIPARANAMLDGYQSIRTLNASEKSALPVLLRGAALRFLLTRLHDLLHHDKDALVKPKDPLEYLAKLNFFKTYHYVW